MSFQRGLLYPSVTVNDNKVSKELNGKTILITGATYGIGEALVRRLLNHPTHLILVARTTEKLQHLKNESLSLRANVTTFTCDLSREEMVQELCQFLKDFHIDYFVSNAGKSIMRSLEESRDRFPDYKRTIGVNYLGPVQLISALIKQFSEARTHIVHISTYNVLMKTPPYWSAYVSSKKAMHSWFESNIPELRHWNITVSHVYFPLIESRMKDANPTYQHTIAMRSNTAVAIMIKALLKRNYHFRPWWHVPAQAVLFLIDPFWTPLWYRFVRHKKS